MMRFRLPHIHIKHVNTVLFVTIILVDAYILGAPFLPGIIDRPVVPPASAITPSPAPKPSSAPASSPSAPLANQLLIPAMQLDQPIYEGRDTYAELNKGVLRWPDSSTPDKGSNTVLLGHRFTYTNPRGVFYFLNLVKVDDPISVIWNNTTYTYHVYNVEVVPPSQTGILNSTTEPTLTIYTCTPTWWPVNRLVIIAHLDTPS